MRTQGPTLLQEAAPNHHAREETALKDNGPAGPKSVISWGLRDNKEGNQTDWKPSQLRSIAIAAQTEEDHPWCLFVLRMKSLVPLLHTSTVGTSLETGDPGTLRGAA